MPEEAYLSHDSLDTGKDTESGCDSDMFFKDMPSDLKFFHKPHLPKVPPSLPSSTVGWRQASVHGPVGTFGI